MNLTEAIAQARRLDNRDQLAAAERIAQAAGTTLGRIWQHDRNVQAFKVRCLIATYLRDEGATLPEIGRVLKRDHTTIMWMLKKHRWDSNGQMALLEVLT